MVYELFRLVKIAVEDAEIMSKGLLKLNIYVGVGNYFLEIYDGTKKNHRFTMPSGAAGWDLFGTVVAVIPGFGWIISGAYWLTSAGCIIFAHKTLGQVIDDSINRLFN